MLTSKKASRTIYRSESKNLTDFFHPDLFINAPNAPIVADTHVAPLKAYGSHDGKTIEHDKTICNIRFVPAVERERTYSLVPACNRSEQLAAPFDSDGLLTESVNRKESQIGQPKPSTPARTRHKPYELTAHARDEQPVRIAYARDRPSRISDLTPV
jgi:hypothetical protein